MPEFDTTFLLACVIVVAAAAAAGLAGFGFSIISVPVLLLLYDPSTVIALNKFLTLGTTWIVLIGAWRSISWPLLRRVVPFAIAGLGLGVILLTRLDTAAITLLVGAVVTFFALLLLAGGVRSIRERAWLAPLLGAASGTLSTSTGLGGPPIVLYFTLIGVPVDIFRATSVVYFLSIDLVSFPLLVSQGVITLADATLALWLAPAALLGRWAGSWLVPYVSPVQFRRVTLFLLLLTGAIAIVNGLMEVSG